MKKIISAMAIAALAVACAKENIGERQLPEGTMTGMELVGHAAPVTKTSIGELADGFYPILWEAGDNIGIYGCTAGSNMKNVRATLHSESDGLNSGTFVVSDQYTLAEGKNDFIIYYPYDASVYKAATEGVDGSAGTPEQTRIDVEKKTASQFLIPSAQTQDVPNSSDGVGKYSFAYALTSVESVDEKPEFTLNHVNTYVKITVGSSEFASYTLQSVSLADKSAEEPAVLSGSVDVNMNDGSYTVANPSPYVTVTVSDPRTLASPQDVYLTALPCDLTGKDVYVVITMANETQTVTIPVGLEGRELKANCLNIIKVEDVKMSDNRFEWFDPVETRYLAGGWCYGDANTIFSETDGGTINFSVKAHGDFAGCVEPAKVVMQYACSNNPNVDFKFITINGETYQSQEELNVKAIELKSDYSFDISFGKCGYKAYAGKLLLYDAYDNLIWAFNLWGSDTPIKEIPLKSGLVIADKNIGGNEYDIDPKAGRGGSFYFQWGRPFGFGWPSGIFPNKTTEATTLAYSAENADTFLKYQGNAAAGIDWWVGQSGYRNRADRRDDFWGNPNQTSELNQNIGEKSIFDPCPEGWMVICPKAMDEMAADMEFVNGGGDGNWMRYCYDGENYVYFPFSGLKWGETAGNSNNNTSHICGTWTNSTASGYGSSTDGATIYWWRATDYTEATLKLESLSNGRATGVPVRCMKDPKAEQ